jgi:hypothetical protein
MANLIGKLIGQIVQIGNKVCLKCQKCSSLGYPVELQILIGEMHWILGCKV